MWLLNMFPLLLNMDIIMLHHQFPHDLQGFSPVQAQVHWWCQTLMVSDKVWLTVRALIHPKGVGGAEVTTLRRPVRLFHTKHQNFLFLYTLSLNGKGPSSNCRQKVGTEGPARIIKKHNCWTYCSVIVMLLELNMKLSINNSKSTFPDSFSKY